MSNQSIIPNSNKKTKGLALLAVSALLLAGCGQQAQQGYVSDSPQPFPTQVLQATATTLQVHYPASLEGEKNIEIRPKIDGYIQQILVDEGSTVKKGQLLFRISAPQYEQEAAIAAAAIKSAEAEVSAARLQISNLVPLVKKEIITNTAMEAAQYNLQAKEALLAQAKASLANARTNIGYTSITSPVDGVVGSLPSKIGSLVSPTAPQPLTIVSEIRNIHAYFSFDEKEFLAFTAKYSGKTVQEKISQMPGVTLVMPDGTVFPERGKIETANGIVDHATGSVSFRATFPNPNGIIRSGGSATIEIPLSIPNALILPQKASFEIQGKKMVYLVDAKGMVKSREIQVMELGSGTDYVVESGLKPGDQIVIEGMGNLSDSIIIKPIPVKPSVGQ